MLWWLLASIPRYLSLIRSQYWNADRMALYRKAKLNQTLHAAAAIPFYKDRFTGMPNANDLGKLPILMRADLIPLARSVIGLYPQGTNFSKAESSGTTGQSVEVLFDASHQRGRFAARARYLAANGWRPWHRSLWMVGLQAGTTPDYEFTRSRMLGKARFLSHVVDFSIQAQWLSKFDPHFVYTLPSNLDALLQILEGRPRPLPALRKIFTGGEVLEDGLRERTRQLLGVEISDNYGSTELFIAWQCPVGAYHVNAEHTWVEIVDDRGNPVAPGQMGRVVVTTLENHLMPLIRYDMGDYAVALDGTCGCGRTLPLIGTVVGRGINLFRDPAGKLVSPWKVLDTVSDLPELRKLQVIQKKLDTYVVRFVSDAPLAPDLEQRARAKFLQVVGSCSVKFERVPDIPRTKRGKFMSTLSEVDRPITSDCD